MLVWAFSACGGSGLPPAPPGDYGARIADCIASPRPRSDAAQARMLSVPAGPATIGSTEQERAQARRDYGRGGETLFKNELEARRIKLPAFRMDASPVTNAPYAEFVAACGALPPDAEAFSPQRWAELARRFGLTHAYADVQRFLWPDYAPPADRFKHPVVLVDHDAAGFYCAWRGGRLPSELEWERAARGPEGRAYPFGNRYDPSRVNTAARGEHDTLEVGVLEDGNTPDGFTDMGGNVFEWTSTRASGQPERYMVKGNAWDGRGGYGRGAARLALAPGVKDVTLGFRCAASR